MADTYLVGGAVRDKLLKRPVTERDWVVVGASPQFMLEQGFTEVGKDFPVFLHPDTHEEYALARTERKTAPGYTGFSFYAAPDVTLEQDLARRDLTINAIAETPDGTLIDPYGGQKDLDNRLLRHVSEAFREDPVRILRIARFAARYHHLGFTIETSTLALMKDMVAAGEVEHLVAERVWKEMEKALKEPTPEVFFRVLRDCHALKVLIPELDHLFGVPQTKIHHPEIDTGEHTLMVLQQARHLSESSAVALAALLHDLGKGLTPKEQWPRHIGHEGAGVKLIERVCHRLAVPKYHRELAVLVGRDHTHCHRALELRPNTLLDLLQRADAFRRPQKLEDFLLACEADSRGRTGFEERPYPQAEYIRDAFARCQSISARDLASTGLGGKEIGEQLKKRRIAAIKAVRDTGRGKQ